MLAKIRTQVFRLGNIQELNIGLKDLFYFSFEKFLNLEKLILRNVIITNKIFKNLKKINLLSINSCDIINLNEEIFEDLINLKFLYFRNNNFLKFLPKNVFKNLINLELLDLSNNNLEKFDLSNLENLKELLFIYKKLW